MGFSAEVTQIVRATPRGRQTLLFSATLSRGDVAGLASLALRKPVRLAADAAWAAPAGLVHEVVRLKGPGGQADKEAVLMALAARTLGARKGGGESGGGAEAGGAAAPPSTSGGGGGGAIIFFRTKQAAHRAAMLFGLAGLPPAAELHGNMTQAARLGALERFRTGAAAALLATDVAARGLDVLGVRLVINADAPPSVATYLHRAGRTARAGASGRVVTLVSDGDRKLMKAVARGGGPSGAPAPRLTARTIPGPALAAWRARLEGLEGDVRRLVVAEAEETALRKAEMEAAKAEHLVDHAAEIAARPPRTWFQTGAEKKRVAAAAKVAAEAEAAEPGGGNAKARKEAKRADLKRERAATKESAARAAKRARLVTETAGLTRSIRALKSRAAALKTGGVLTSGKAAKAAAAEVTGVSQATSKARKKAAAKLKERRARKGGGSGCGGEGGDELGDGGPPGATSKPPPRPPPSRVYAGGPKSGALRAPAKGGRSKADAKAAKRGGKGAKAFKSKAKHRRRK